jgi:hypothetical protein
MTGASWFFVSLARHAREDRGELTEWLNEAETATGFNHSTGWADLRSRFPNPDGAGTWAQDGRQVRFLLEYDTGSENLPALAGKLDGYQALASAAAWNDQVCPVVLFCFTSPRWEQTARRALAATRGGPRAAHRHGGDRPAHRQPGRSGCRCSLGIRCTLADLDDAIPDPWLAYRQEQAHKRREVARRERMYRDDQDGDEDPISEGSAPHASGEASRRYDGSGHWVPGRTAS